MNNKIINILLGASLIIAAPAAMADSNWKQNKAKNKHTQKYSQKKQIKHVQQRPNKKPSFVRATKKRHYYGRVIRDRLDNQARKINKGVKRGQLVRGESKQLRKEQRRINQRFASYRQDGRLNRHESNKLNRMLDRASANIRNLRHNRVTKYSQYRGNDRFVRHNDRHNNVRYEFVLNW